MFVVETGAGLSNANSYLSVADADTYHADHSGSADWSGADNADKEKALRLATQYLDAKYGKRWKGIKGNTTQALDWPRTGAYDENNYLFDSDSLPQKLKDATAELALKIVQGDTLFEDIEEAGTLVDESVQVGPISVRSSYAGGKSEQKKYSLVEALIKDLVEDSNIIKRR